jgi:hypothetical protein
MAPIGIKHFAQISSLGCGAAPGGLPLLAPTGRAARSRRLRCNYRTRRYHLVVCAFRHIFSAFVAHTPKDNVPGSSIQLRRGLHHDPKRDQAPARGVAHRARFPAKRGCAPLDEDVTLLVREGRGRRSTSVPVPADRGRLDRFEQWNAADRHADKVEAVHSQPL